jgi:hypothetical protein
VVQRDRPGVGPLVWPFSGALRADPNVTSRVEEIEFLTQLGRALSAAGDPVSSTERTRAVSPTTVYRTSRFSRRSCWC